MFRAIDKSVLPLFSTSSALNSALRNRFAPNKSFTIFTGDVVESAVWAVDQAVSLSTRCWVCLSDSPSSFTARHR